MNGNHRIPRLTGRNPFGMRGLFTSLAATACAVSLALLGCSDAKKPTPKTITNPEVKKPDVKTVVTALDSLVKANKGTGKGIITGFLGGEGKSIAKGLFKQASNAAGERRFMTRTEIPLTGATVLIFNAEKPTTVADTTLKTDSTGNYTAALAEGKYFGFAVYLDLETFQLVTTSIPNMNPVKDTIIKMDTAIAIEDATAPTVVGVYDAAAANDDGVFLVGSLPATKAKINITFSEPMNRESAKGVVLGKVDTSSASTSLTLADTAKSVTVTWSGDSKEMTLNVAELAEGVQYGIVIPVSLKDLAKNNLESQYKATFAPVAAKDLEAVAFAVAANFPEDKGGLKPIQNPGISFNRPVDVFSVVKGAKIDPAVTGFWEVSGARAVFMHKTPLEVGKTYTISLPVDVKDLGGNALGKAFSYSFTVKDFEGAAKDAVGADKLIALTVESVFDAYMQGDLGRFAAAFHANFRHFDGDGSIQSKAQFVDDMRKEVGDRVSMGSGVPAPVFDTDTSSCKNNLSRWKVGAIGSPENWVWVESFVNPGSVPRVWDKDRNEIARAKLEWDRTGPRFKYDGRTYGFAPDFSKFGGGVNMDVAREDFKFMGDIMAKTSSILLEPVKMERVMAFKVDGGMSVTGDTARLAVKMSGTEKHSRLNFEPRRGCEEGGSNHEFFQVLKFQLVNDGARWLVLSIVSPSGDMKREDFDKAVDVKNNFGGSTAKPIALLSPVNGRDNVASAEGKVTFKFEGVKHDSVGGYIVGIAEDPKFTGGRPPFGVLLFVKASSKTGGAETFVLDGSGKVVDGDASAVLRRVQDMRLPGWERTLFEYTLSKLHNPDSGFAGVYQWKVIAVKDTSAAQFLGNGFNPARYYGESDFGPARGYFAVKGYPAANQFAKFESQQFNMPPTTPGSMGGPVGFGDMDQDGIPDFMEQKYGSEMRDRNSYPDFRVDSDGDKMCDYLEKKLDPTGKDSLVDKAADAAQLKEQIAALGRLIPPIHFEDGDGDGFPDDVEQLYGFNPRDPFQNPGTKMRANVPVGVFSGKVQMGTSTHSISFKLYQDSTKNLWVAMTAYFGKDTVKDTSRAGFNEMMGEVQIALPLPKNGPDSGKALLLRGMYQAGQSLLMGSVDMIMAPAVKTSVAFGGGPYVGQFAASGRGDDVSMYLPGGMGGGPNMGPMPGPMSGPIYGPGPGMPGGVAMPSYRMPPPGTSEGAKIAFSAGKVVLIDDFGDTLGVIHRVDWRSQPDGSFEVFAEERIGFINGTRRIEMGGRMSLGPDGWVLDGHFMQSLDSAGNHRDIPGQLCAKASKADLAPMTGTMGMEGTLKGWIAQDKFGAGFSGPGAGYTGVPACSPGMPCDPATGGGTMPGGTLPGGTLPGGVMPGGTMPGGTGGYMPPVNSFARPYMGGTKRVQELLSMDTAVKSSGYFHVSISGRLYRVKFDSTGLADSKFPMCGQSVVAPEVIPLKEGAGPTEVSGRNSDSMSIQGYASHSLILLVEDQFAPGMPARMEKARDAQGGIHVNVLVAEMRPKAYDYGSATGQCFSPGVLLPPGGTNPPGGYIPPGGTIPGPMSRTPFTGTLEVLKPVLSGNGYAVYFKKDDMDPGSRQAIDPASLYQDPVTRHVFCQVLGVPTLKLVFLGLDSGKSLVYAPGGLPMATLPIPTGIMPNPIGNPIPVDTAKPPVIGGYLPPKTDTVYVPPTTGGYLPPKTDTVYVPPTTGGYLPPKTDSGYIPPTTGGYIPPSTGGYLVPDSTLKGMEVKPGDILTFSALSGGVTTSVTYTVTPTTTLFNIAQAMTSFIRGPSVGAGLGATADIVQSVDSPTLAGTITLYGNSASIMDFKIHNSRTNAIQGPIMVPAGSTRLASPPIRVVIVAA